MKKKNNNGNLNLTDEEWLPTPKASTNGQSNTKRIRKPKCVNEKKNKKLKKEPSTDDDEEEFDDMYILMEKLQQLKEKKKRKKEQQHQTYLNSLTHQTMKAIQELIKKGKEAEQEKRAKEALEIEKMFTEIQNEFKDWYSTFNSLHQAYLTDMAKLNRQYTRQCKRLDAIIAGSDRSDETESKEEAKKMETKLLNIMKGLKKKIMEKDN